jgi:hypothetical protein
VKSHVLPVRARSLVMVLALAMLLPLSGRLRADDITLTYNEDPASFSFIVESVLGINGNDHHNLNGGSDWRNHVRFFEREGQEGLRRPRNHDSMLVIVTGRHINAPHGEDPNKNEYLYAEPCHAIVPSPEPGMRTCQFAPRRVEHPGLGHFDEIEGRLEFETAFKVCCGGLDIVRWTFILKGRHTEDGPPTE